MKKTVSFILCCIILLVALSACSEKPTYQFKRANAFLHECTRVRVSDCKLNNFPTPVAKDNNFVLYKIEDLNEYKNGTSAFKLVTKSTANDFYPDSLKIPTYTDYFFTENILLIAYTKATENYSRYKMKDVKISNDNVMYVLFEQEENMEYDPIETEGGWFFIIEVNRSELSEIEKFGIIVE